MEEPAPTGQSATLSAKSHSRSTGITHHKSTAVDQGSGRRVEPGTSYTVDLTDLRAWPSPTK